MSATGTAVALLACAALFALWGLVVRFGRKPGGCSTCSSVCHSKEARHGGR